jgi:hypothetical protein
MRPRYCPEHIDWTVIASYGLDTTSQYIPKACDGIEGWKLANGTAADAEHREIGTTRTPLCVTQDLEESLTPQKLFCTTPRSLMFG